MLHEYRVCRIFGIPWRETLQRMIRAPIAMWMNRYPDTCWADLVRWWVVPTVNPFWEIRYMRNSAKNCGYCGKCEQKVHVVTSGSYSDYGINAVFSTRELAQAYIDRWGSEDFDIEEWNLDSPDPFSRPGKNFYMVWMKRSGDTESVRAVPPRESEVVLFTPHYATPQEWATLTVYCWATDEQHAVKIANEKRTQAIATGKAPE